MDRVAHPHPNPLPLRGRGDTACALRRSSFHTVEAGEALNQRSVTSASSIVHAETRRRGEHRVIHGLQSVASQQDRSDCRHGHPDVTPAKAGVHIHRSQNHFLLPRIWIPAFAGMTIQSDYSGHNDIAFTNSLSDAFVTRCRPHPSRLRVQKNSGGAAQSSNAIALDGATRERPTWPPPRYSCNRYCAAAETVVMRARTACAS